MASLSPEPQRNNQSNHQHSEPQESNVVATAKDKSAEELASLEVAEDSRETHWEHPSFVAELFMGNLDLSSVYPYPEQSAEDLRTGDEFIAKLDTFLKEKVDGDKIDLESEIPQEVMKGMADLGLFAIKIPKEYGGLGFSQANYLRILAHISRYCGSTAALLSAHQSIGVPQPLLMFGTEEQKKKYLPRFAKGEISAFALTEPGVGSDPAKMATTAIPTEDGEHFVINGDKLWCTNGVIADVLVVMAKTPPKMVRGKERQQISAFIVDTKTPGFEVVHRCSFLGLHGIQNGLLKFRDVKVPKENMIWGEGKGLKLALMTLNAGRLSLPACCVGGGREVLGMAREWGQERSQWGAPVGKHEAGAVKLASLSGHLLAMESMTWLAGAWVDQKAQDIRLEAAMAKLFCSMKSHEGIEKVLQLRGGRGYETAGSLKARGEKPFPIERIYRDSRINQIVEGTNEILQLFIAREALDRHLRLAGAMLNPKLPMSTRIATFFKAGAFYATWYPKQWLGTLFSYLPIYGTFGRNAKHMRYVKRQSHRLARTTFHMMAFYGPKLERRQSQLIRIVDIATDLLAMTSAMSKARTQRDQSKGIEKTADSFCWEARERVDLNFSRIFSNSDLIKRDVAKDVMQDGLTWQEDAR